MPNLINQDSAGNTFYNYITPVIRGESMGVGTQMRSNVSSFLATALGASGGNWIAVFGGYNLRVPAPGLEMKTAPVTGNLDGDARMEYYPFSGEPVTISSNNVASGGGYNRVGVTSSPYTYNPLDKFFAVINDYAAVSACFSSDFSTLKRFLYLGWLREPVYTGPGVGVLGLVAIGASGAGSIFTAVRPSAENLSDSISLSTAANSITTPPINCSIATPVADATDITIRDAASPHNPVGKLWNCIQLPASCNVGELWRNVGVDADGGGSDQDVYLCVMPWGTAKLGMRVWTEGVN